MNWIEFSEKVIGHVVTLVVAFAWPAVVVVLLISQRRAIAALIDRIKTVTASKDGLKVDIDPKLKANAEKIEEAKEAVAPVVEQLPHTDTNVLVETARKMHEWADAYALSYEIASDAWHTKPSVIIERAWADVENALYRVIEGEERPSFTHVTGNDLLQKAASEKLLDRKLLEAIVGLLNIRNETVTGIMGWEPTREQASEFVANAAEVLKLLEPYLVAGLIGQAPKP
jgi:hypothetical protein